MKRAAIRAWVAVGAASVFACNQPDSLDTDGDDRRAETDYPPGEPGSAPSDTPGTETSSGSSSAPARSAAPAGSTVEPTNEVAPKVMSEEIDADMQDVLNELESLGAKPLATLSPKEARKQPTLRDAVLSLQKKRGLPTTPVEVAKVENRKIPGAAGQIAARVYTPKVETELPPRLPVVAYWHGGGFVLADLDAYDASARALAKESEAVVVSFDYRRAPENKFPAAHDDAFAAYQWLLDNAASVGGDPKRIAVAGESAGGNLALNVAIAAKVAGLPLPKHQLLIYPVASNDMGSESYQEWGNARPLDKPMMTWFVDHYTRTPDDAKDPRINLVAASLAGLGPTTIILAEIDPLRSEGELLAKQLEAADVDVKVKTYEGVTHEFFGLGAVVADAKDAEEFAGDRLEDALEED